MLRSTFPTGCVLVVAFLSALWSPIRTLADGADDLKRAVALFDSGDYLGAQEALLGLDREALQPDQQTLRDDYLNRTQVALRMSEKAIRDLEDAETAIGEKETDKARRLLESVIDNKYAAEAVKQSARTMMRNLGGPVESGAAPAMPAASTPQPEAASSGQPERTPKVAAAEPGDAAAKARELVAAAEAALAAGDLGGARRQFEAALAMVPGLPEAVDGLTRVQEHERNVSAAGSDSLIARIRSQNEINWQRTVAEYREVESGVRGNVTAERFEEAQQLMIRARQIVESGRQFADPPAKYETLRAELDALAQHVDNAERDFNQRRVAEIRRQIEEERAARLQEDEANRRRQVDALMQQAMQHRKDGDLDSAITVLKQITVVDPKDKTARWMLDELEEIRQFRRGRTIYKDITRETQNALIDVEESKIPWHVELQYPDNWLEIISRPERGRPGVGSADRRLLSALDQSINVDFKGDSLDKVIERLADAHRLNIIVNWRDLERAGVERKSAIELSLPQEITLQKALTEILDQAGGGVELGYEVSGGAMKIATRTTLDKETYTSVYDIQDLLMEVPNFRQGPMTDLGQTLGAPPPSSDMRQQRPWLYGGGEGDDDDEADADPDRAARVKKIVDLIMDTISPDSWIDRGGSVGMIREINGQLVVTQNSATQRQVANLLGKLREQRAVQIAVEARFITVSAHYLEELGMDLDITLNAGNAGFDYIPSGSGVLTDPVLGNPMLLPRSFSRLGFGSNSPAGGQPLTQNPGTINQPFGRPFLVPQNNGGSNNWTPIPIQNNVTNLTNPLNLPSDVPGSFAGQNIPPAFNMFGSFLDNIQVDFLIRATQADSRTSVLTAPRLVLFNGQRSWVAVTIQQAFVSQLNPVVATGAVAQAPQTGVIDSGAVLDVVATVSADKRYVTLTVRPGVTRLLDLQTIPFSGGGAGGGIGGGGTALPAFIQLPTLSSQRVQTTVSVPDGGTLLIGGQKLASEAEIEAGVPVLSKIPILKRAYSSRSAIKDEQTLLILIKPKIFIQTEQEEAAFPTFRG